MHYITLFIQPSGKRTEIVIMYHCCTLLYTVVHFLCLCNQPACCIRCRWAIRILLTLNRIMCPVNRNRWCFSPVLTASTDNAFITRCACLSLILACMLEKPRDIPTKTWHLILEIVLLCSHETTGEFDASDAVGMPACACIRHHFKAGNTSRYAR